MQEVFAIFIVIACIAYGFTSIKKSIIYHGINIPRRYLIIYYLNTFLFSIIGISWCITSYWHYVSIAILMANFWGCAFFTSFSLFCEKKMIKIALEYYQKYNEREKMRILLENLNRINNVYKISWGTSVVLLIALVTIGILICL